MHAINYSIEIEFKTEDHKGKVHDRKQTIILAIRSGEHVITRPEVTVASETVKETA